MKKILFTLFLLFILSCEDNNSLADTKECPTLTGSELFSIYGEPKSWIFKPTNPIDENIILSPIHNGSLSYSWAIDSLTKDTIPIFYCGKNPFLNFPKIISLDDGYYFIQNMFISLEGSWDIVAYNENCELRKTEAYCEKMSLNYINLDDFKYNPSQNYLNENVKEMLFDSKNMTELHWVVYYLINTEEEMEKYKDSTNYYSTSGRYVKITETDTLVAVRPYLAKSNGILVDELDLTELDSIYTQQGYEIQKGRRYYGDIEKHIEDIRVFLNDRIKNDILPINWNFPIKETR